MRLYIKWIYSADCIGLNNSSKSVEAIQIIKTSAALPLCMSGLLLHKEGVSM